MKTCPACGAGAANEAAFCPRCGTAFSSVCGHCGATLAPDARFCSTCGRPVAAAEPSQERKLVTVLFSDVAGFTPLGDRLDAERLKDVMDAYFAAMREAIESQGGTVEKFIGDAVMAVFGVPVAHEDDPARALRAALTMRDRLTELNARLAESQGFTLEMRIGVNSGEVIALTEAREGVGMVTGDAVSVAARLEQNAEPGQVLVAERVARATRGFVFAEVGPLALKGKGQAVRALRLIRAEAVAERGIAGLAAPLVGRDSEMTLLESLFTRVAAEGRPHLVTLYGDPGVGKSRLVAEFLQRLEARPEPPLTLSGRCLPYGEGVTYWPLAEILKTLGGILDTDPSDLVVEKIRKLGRELLTADVTDEPARATAALAYTVGVEDPTISFRDLSPRQVRLETHGAWRSFFSGLASDRPVVALIEDIHWADTALLDLLEELADKLEGAVLLVCPSRPELTERRAAWGGGKRNFSSIFLDPLSADDARRLVGFLLSIEDLAKDVHDRILARAEGNPFFLEEIIRHLIDEGRIIHEGGRWRGTPECGEVAIPDTVQGVLAARIDLLSPAEKRVVQSAAVVGRVFWTGPVSRLVGDDVVHIEDALDRLEGRELIRARLSSSIAGDRECIFKHVLTRDVAYESLPRRERASAHATVASWLAETAGERRREFAELLAHHSSEAHRAAEFDPRLTPNDIEAMAANAYEHTLLAADVVRKRFATDAAIRLAEQALALARTPLERTMALETIGLAYQNNYEGDHAWRTLKEAIDEATTAQTIDDRRIARLCAEALETPLRWPGSMHVPTTEDDARSYLELGLAHAERIPGDSPELARLLTARSFWLYGFPADFTEEMYRSAVSDGERAAEIARRLNLPEVESAALDATGSVWMMEGRYRETVPLIRRRRELSVAMRDPWEIGDIYAMDSWIAYVMGRYEDSIRATGEGLHRIGDGVTGQEVHSLSWRFFSLYRLGRWDEALEDLRTIEDALGDRRALPPGFAARPYAAGALIHEIRGNGASADEYVTLLTTLGALDAGLLPWAPWLGPLLLRRGRIEEATALTEEALRHPRPGALKVLLFEPFCDFLAATRAWERARTEAPKMRERAERGGYATLPFAVDRLEGRAAIAHGDNERGVDLLARAAAGFAGHGVVWEEAVTLLPLAEALRPLGRGDEADDALTRADATFERLRAPQERARVRELRGST